MHFDQTTLVDHYGDQQGYLADFTRSLDATVAAGFLLESDRAQLLAEAEAVSSEPDIAIVALPLARKRRAICPQGRIPIEVAGLQAMVRHGDGI